MTLTSALGTQVKLNQWATSYLSYNDPRLHFGLGDAAIVDSIEIRWPDGESQVLRDVPVNQYLTVSQGMR